MEELRELFEMPNRRFYIYGAGYQGSHLLANLRCDSSLKSCAVNIKNMLVTSKNGNPDKVGGVPVVECDRSAFDENDCIIIAVDKKIKGEIADYLKGGKAELIDVHYGTAVYKKIYKSISSFAEVFPDNIKGINKPLRSDYGRIVWSCWWQGEADAPDIVKACWQSQRNNLSEDVRHVVITKDNYFDYITIPGYILEKFEDGNNLTAHLSDFIRVSLLYKYGGVWLDATVLLLEELPEECWELPLYSWRSEKIDNLTLFASESKWTTWFLAAQKGSVLYQFIMEAFLYYFSIYEKIDYYFTLDFFISIGTNILAGVSEQFRLVPYNNETAARLIGHLNEPYSGEKFREYCEGSFLQKLTWHRNDYAEDSIFNHILKDIH